MSTTLPSIRYDVLKLGLQTIAIGAATGLGLSYTAIAGLKLKQAISKDEFLPQALRKKEQPIAQVGMNK